MPDFMVIYQKRLLLQVYDAAWFAVNSQLLTQSLAARPVMAGPCPMEDIH